MLCSRLIRQLPKNLLESIAEHLPPKGENWANSGKSKVFNAFELFTSRFRANEIVENSKLHFPCRHGRGFILIIERTASLLHRYPRFLPALPVIVEQAGSKDRFKSIQIEYESSRMWIIAIKSNGDKFSVARWNDTRKVEVHYGSSNIKKFARSTPRFLYSKRRGGGGLFVDLFNKFIGLQPLGTRTNGLWCIIFESPRKLWKEDVRVFADKLSRHNVRRKKREKVKSLDGKFGVRLWIVWKDLNLKVAELSSFLFPMNFLKSY